MTVNRERLAQLATENAWYKGRYRNPERTPKHGLADFVRWQLSPGERLPPGHEFPWHKPDAGLLNRPPAHPQLTWLGHSTFLFQWDGLNLLTDPVLSERASPFSFAGPRRFTPAPLTVEELPRIDRVLISHNHYDHLDDSTVKALHQRFGDSVCFCVPKGLKDWFAKRGISNVVELGWWQSHSFAGDDEVFFVPAQHFSGRGPRDTNKTLWGAWLLERSGHRLFFGGDTGYGSVFKTIGELFAPVDLALLPIGAYEPRWFMAPVHVGPEEAVRIHLDIGALQSVGMHWGTFVLTDEPMDEPPRLLAAELARRSLNPEAFLTLGHGETRLFNAPDQPPADS